MILFGPVAFTLIGPTYKKVLSKHSRPFSAPSLTPPVVRRHHINLQRRWLLFTHSINPSQSQVKAPSNLLLRPNLLLGRFYRFRSRSIGIKYRYHVVSVIEM